MRYLALLCMGCQLVILELVEIVESMELVVVVVVVEGQENKEEVVEMDDFSDPEKCLEDEEERGRCFPNHSHPYFPLESTHKRKKKKKCHAIHFWDEEKDTIFRN